jgi:hypothetical protein
MNDSTGVNDGRTTYRKSRLRFAGSMINSMSCQTIKQHFFVRERRTYLVALIGFFTAILGRCLCVGVFFPFCAVVALKFLGRKTDRWKEVFVWYLRRLDEGNAV